MAKYRGFDLLDYIVFLVHKKIFFITISLAILILSYLTIYFLLPPQYDSTATIISVEKNDINPLSQLASSFSNIPFASLAMGGMGANERYNLFTTVIYSRTFLEDMIDEFDLMQEFKEESLEKVLKQLKSSITVELSPEMAFIITVRSLSPGKAAEMNNYLLNKVNIAVIELNVKKAKENRIFLEDRYSTIKNNLANAEDSLQIFQQRTNFFEVDNQIKTIIEANSKFETELALKEIESSIFAKIYGLNSPQAENSQIALDAYKSEFSKFKSGKVNNSIFIAMKNLPESAKDYIRLFRDVEVYNAMLEFIIPLYEQTKFEEVNSVPVLQIIDRPSLPEKKSYPPRTLFSLLITCIIIFTMSQILFFKAYLKNSGDERLRFIITEIFNFKRKSK
jgi:capsule polysaccharide export protein KpsE/RkpR